MQPMPHGMRHLVSMNIEQWLPAHPYVIPKSLQQTHPSGLPNLKGAQETVLGIVYVVTWWRVDDQSAIGEYVDIGLIIRDCSVGHNSAD